MVSENWLLSRAPLEEFLAIYSSNNVSVFTRMPTRASSLAVGTTDVLVG